jgi:glucose-6-phosphate isomerase
VQAVYTFIEEINQGKRPAFSCVLNMDTWEQAKAYAAKLKDFDHILWLGMGGSTLGAQVLTKILTPSSNRITYLDNSDPLTLKQTLKTVNLEKTAIVCVSKSGGTTETLLTACLILEAINEKSISPHGKFFAITEEKESPLTALCESVMGLRIPHDPIVGGRFSIFSIVGLMALAIEGGNQEFLGLAKAELEAFIKSPETHHTYKTAEILHSSNLTNYILMLYGDRFKIIGEWFVQLWAESLGKDGKGLWPSVARGASDQHACLQMMMDGVNNSFITLMREDTKNSGTSLSKPWAKTLNSPLLNNLDMGDFLYYQAEGTFDALKGAGRNVRLLETSPKQLGKSLMSFMLETLCMSAFMGIDPWDQPAVEDAKARTSKYLK